MAEIEGKSENSMPAQMTAQIPAQEPREWRDLKWEWPGRAAMAADHLKGVKSVVDIGCGRMTLKGMLPPHVAYQGLDVASRDEDTIVLDLNEEALPDLDYEAAVILGVIEYLNDPPAVFERLQQFERVILSYNTYGVKDILARLGIYKRQPKEWPVRLRVKEVRALLERNGFAIEAQRKVRLSEYMFVARRKKTAQN